MNLEEEYNLAVSIPSDINEHLEYLRSLCANCSTVVEFGIGPGRSTRSFLVSDVELHSYDINIFPGIKELFIEANNQGKKAFLYNEDTISSNIIDTDMLFVDSLHTYEQVKGELENHHNKVKKYLVFHDTVSFGENGELPNSKGINYAIREFLEDHQEWEIYEDRKNNNGLLVLIRR